MRADTHDTLRRERITEAEHADWMFACRLYETSFPPTERRSLVLQEEFLAHSHYHFDVWYDGDAPIAVLGWWDFRRLRFFEHLAVDTSRRSSGYGKKIMRTMMRMWDKPILLEIEPPVDEMTRRRRRFYTKLGFIENDFDHLQTSYCDPDAGVPLRVLSWPGPLEPELYVEFLQLQRFETIGHFPDDRRVDHENEEETWSSPMLPRNNRS